MFGRNKGGLVLDNYKVYRHISPSGKMYIGITRQDIKKRWANGRGYKDCPAFRKAIQKYGWDNIKHEILLENLTKEEAEQKEIELIAKYKSNQKQYGYNIENGGNCCGTHSEETKRKIGLANKGKIVTQETSKKLSESHKGKYIGEQNGFFGKHHSEKVKKEHSEFMKGNQYNKGKHHSEEFKEIKSKQMHEKYKDGGNPKCKKVIQTSPDGSLIKEYFSLREAARTYKVSTATIYNWIHNPKNKEWSYEK